MGRSVDYLRDSIKVLYTSIEYSYIDEDGNECEDDMAWDDLLDNMRYGLMSIIPSLYEANEMDRETLIFLENGLIEVGISEYCGVVSISFRGKKDGLSERFMGLMYDRIKAKISEFTSLYERVGGFSNGESIYSKIN
jgi:hypothetical protein